jgi:hypothetical protein
MEKREIGRDKKLVYRSIDRGTNRGKETREGNSGWGPHIIKNYIW